MRRILVPTDFSDHALAAAGLAVSIARAKGAEVTLLHGLQLFEAVGAPAKAQLSYETRELTEAQHQMAQFRDELVDPAADDVCIETRVQRGEPAPAILAYAESWRPDLIVIGSRGQESEDRLQFGSVAQRLTRRAPCPVLVTRSGQTERFPEGGLFRAPLVAVDYSKFSKSCAALARELSDKGAVIEMLHVYFAPDLADDPDLQHALGEARAEEITRLEQFARDVDIAPLAVNVRAEVGKVAAQLLQYVGGSKTDVVILGAHGRDTAVELIGSVADRVLRVSPAPVIIIPERAL